MVLKWRNKRNLYMISTMHNGAVSENGKPKVVETYNKRKCFMKCFVDLSDQMAAYSPFLRKTTKWYIRVFSN